MVETARIGEAPPPRAAALPVALPAPNREAPRGRVHAATN